MSKRRDGFDIPERSIQRIVMDVEPGNEVSVTEGYFGYIGTSARVIAVGKPATLAAATRRAEQAEAAVARVRELFYGGPDTPCRTTWPDGVECVEVPMADLRHALDGEDAS